MLFYFFLLLLYLVFVSSILSVIFIAFPRLAKTDSTAPIYYFIGFYIGNTICLNYLFKVNPMLTMLLNLILLGINNIIGNRLRLIGLTGQVCSGKTSVCNYLLNKYDCSIIEIDKLNREVLERQETKNQIRKIFGDDVFDEDGNLLRMELRKIIYSDPKKKKQLEKITHTKVFLLLIKRILYEKLIKRKKHVFLENAILLQIPRLRLICFPVYALVTSNKADIIRRIMNRDKCDQQTAENMLNNQMKIEDFVIEAEHVIYNDSDSLEPVYKEIDCLMESLA